MTALVDLLRELIRAPRAQFARGALLLGLIAVIVIGLIIVSS